MTPIRVLLVDDEKEFTEVLAERLETRGMLVEVADNGPDALELANEQTFDAVVLDLQMPGMDGIDTLKRMLRLNPDLQVILLTGHGTLDKSVEAMKSGAMEFLEKPPDMNVLIERLSEAKSTARNLTEKRMEDTLSSIMKKHGW